jgi:Zn-finger nucleic acid-binding protein
MKCPVDDSVLEMSERQGIEIDYCPRCRGVWLDRGELAKIVERSERPERHENSDRHEEPAFGFGRRPARKKRSFFGELFDD